MNCIDHLNARVGGGRTGKVRVAPFIERDLRAAFFAGADLIAVGSRHGLAPHQVESIVAYRRTRWEEAEATRRALEAKGCIVVMKPFARKTGSFDWRPVSLPYVSMHAAALAEAAR